MSSDWVIESGLLVVEATSQNKVWCGYCPVAHRISSCGLRVHSASSWCAQGPVLPADAVNSFTFYKPLSPGASLGDVGPRRITKKVMGVRCFSSLITILYEGGLWLWSVEMLGLLTLSICPTAFLIFFPFSFLHLLSHTLRCQSVLRGINSACNLAGMCPVSC